MAVELDHERPRRIGIGFEHPGLPSDKIGNGPGAPCGVHAIDVIGQVAVPTGDLCPGHMRKLLDARDGEPVWIIRDVKPRCRLARLLFHGDVVNTCLSTQQRLKSSDTRIIARCFGHES